jgi:hypothetical protein
MKRGNSGSYAICVMIWLPKENHGHPSSLFWGFPWWLVESLVAVGKWNIRLRRRNSGSDEILLAGGQVAIDRARGYWQVPLVFLGSDPLDDRNRGDSVGRRQTLA